MEHPQFSVRVQDGGAHCHDQTICHTIARVHQQENAGEAQVWPMWVLSSTCAAEAQIYAGAKKRMRLTMEGMATNSAQSWHCNVGLKMLQAVEIKLIAMSCLLGEISKRTQTSSVVRDTQRLGLKNESPLGNI
jgi:hypothetical protein